MPIDASLIGQSLANYQQPVDVLAQYGKLQALKNGIVQQQIQQQTFQENALKLQEAQQDAQDQQTFRDVMQQTQGDYAKAAPLLAGRISQKMQAAFQTAMDARAKSLLDQDKTRLENAKSRNEQIAEGLGAIAQAPPANRAALYGELRGRALAQGIATPDALPEIYPGDDWVFAHRFMATPTKDQIDTALNIQKNTREADKAAAELPGVKADAAQKIRQQDAGALEAAWNQGGPGAFNQALGQLPPDRAQPFAGAASVQDIRNGALTTEQKTAAAQAAANADATAAYRAAQLKNSAQTVAQGWARVKIAQDEAQAKRDRGEIEGPPLTAAGQKQMTEIATVANQFDSILAKLEPYKNDNNPLTFLGPWLKYKVGVKSPEGELGSEISNLSLASIQGMMPFASKSRNYEFIKKIGEHLPRLDATGQDSPALMYDKLSKARRNFLSMQANAARYEVKGAGANPGKPVLPEDSALAYYQLAGGDPAKATKMATEDGWQVP